MIIRLSILLLIINSLSLLSQVQGPNQPEFTNFSSVNNQSLVNEITGDFNYHIPLLNIPGNNGFSYDLKLNYNSDISPSDEASWIGWGWSLNIGSITRIKNGFADDFNNVEVKYFNKKKDNISVNLSTTLDAEILSSDISEDQFSFGSIGAKLNLHYNNQHGYYMSFGGGLSAYRGVGNLNFGFNKTGDLTGSYNFNLSPSHILSAMNDFELLDEETISSINSWAGESDIYSNISSFNLFSLGGNFYNSNLTKFNSTPTVLPKYDTKVYKGRVTGRFDAFPKVGADVGLNGNIVVTKYEEEEIKDVYGYFYSDIGYNRGASNSDFKIVMDYQNTKSDPYIKRDQFLGFPVSNPDEYLVQVEGLSGGFRAHFDKALHFTPPFQENESSDLSLGASANFGPTDFGIGFPLGLGLKGSNKIVPYRRNINNFKKKFVFHNDKALYSNPNDINYNIQTPVLNKSLTSWGFDDVGLNLQTNPTNPVSSYIEYHTIGDLVNQTGFNKKLKFATSNFQNSNLIAEFKITNSDGNSYVFGQPVFSIAEKSVSYGLPPKYNHFVENNFFFPKKFEESQATMKLGQEINQPYANSYLITEIRNSNYYDILSDGPTVDDVGDYIKFEYYKIAGASRLTNGIHLANSVGFEGQWFKWRIPYEGYNYSRGDLANLEDDLVSYSEGEKELFYPKSISTKTHVAIFITNYTNVDKGSHDISDYFGLDDEKFYIVLDDDSESMIGNLGNDKLNEEHPYYKLISGSGKQRKDNWSSNPFGFNIFNYYKNSYSNREKVNENPSRKLERILLFSLDKMKMLPENNPQDGHYYVKDLIKVINFDQDYSLQNKQPNSTVNSSTEQRHGKLTLKSLWSDYGGVFENQVSNYEFKYTYPNITYPNEYSYLNNYGSNLIENPDFSRYNLNSWNKYENDEDNTFNSGEKRKSELFYSVDQTPADEYDPGAWRLKEIKLPSEGEIHIQYEPKDYSYVQNRNVKVLNRITEVETLNNQKVYTLDLVENFKNGLSPQEILALYNELLIEHTAAGSNGIAGKNKKIYGKFLFNYITDDTPEIEYCNSEYIEGFVDVENILIDDSYTPTQIQIVLNKNHFKSICLDKYKNTRIGMVSENTSCGSNSGHTINDIDESILSNMLSNINKVEWSISDNFCKEVNVEKSFFRIPMIRNKLAGGARTKRVLFYDKFNDEIEFNGQNTDEANLYGYEYLYINEDGKSSGVASNEPTKIGKENALVELIKTRDNQTATEEFVEGEDRSQSFGPIGKELLPPPKISYSRVVKKRIGLYDPETFNSTSDGFIIKYYITSKDYPFDYQYNVLNATGGFVKGVNHTKINTFEPTIPFIPTPFYSLDLGYYYATQGYMFVKNSLPGLLSTESHFSGDYYSPESWSLKYQKKMNYVEPGDCVPLFKGFNYSFEHKDNPFITESGIPGIEIESMSEAKSILEESVILNANFDLDFVYIPPIFIIPIPTGVPTLDITKRVMRNYTTNTIINFPSIVKSVEEYKDGITNLRENIVFDHKSGNPILTRDMDEFDGAQIGGEIQNGGIYNYTIPASYNYNSYNKINEVNYALSSGVSVYYVGNYSTLKNHFMLGVSNYSGYSTHSILRKNDEIELTYSSSLCKSSNNESHRFNAKVVYAASNVIIIKPSNKYGDFSRNWVMFDNYILASRKCLTTTEIRNIESFNNNNKINEISDYITVYGGELESVGCINSLPNHFKTKFTYDYETSTQTNKDITTDFNDIIQSKISTSNLSTEMVDMSPYSITYPDVINGEESLNDTSAVQFLVNIDSTINQTLPLDSMEVTLSINQKNTLSTPDSITSLLIVEDLNTLLNELWSRRLITYNNTRDWFVKCQSSDTIGNYIDNYYQGLTDSVQNETIRKNSFYEDFLNYDYLTFNLDSNKNVWTKGSELISDSADFESYVSYRDIDTNYNIGMDKVGYVGKVDMKFKSDTLNDYFNFGHLKYLKPNCNSSNIQDCYSTDCRDTLLKDIPEFANDWNNTFIVLPGNSTVSQKLNFPSNDSLFNFVSNYNSFTDNFGYFSVNQNGKLEYNTINSSFGYNASTTTELFKIFELDSSVDYEHIEEYKFIVDPNNPITSFDIDTNNGGAIFIKSHPQSNEANTASSLDFHAKSYPVLEVENVIDARTVTFSKPSSNISDVKHNLPSNAVFNEYVNYEKDILNYSIDRDYSARSYESGIYDEFQMYFHRDPSRNSNKWRKLNTNSRGQNGNVFENKSLNNIYSAVQYNRLGMTSAVVSNSDFESFYFDSFEYPSLNQMSIISEEISHTGNNSVELKNTDYSLPFGNPTGSNSVINFELTNHMIEQGILVQLWLKIPKNHYAGYTTNEIMFPIGLTYVINGSSENQSFNKITQTGDWSLFEFIIHKSIFEDNYGNTNYSLLGLELPMSIGINDSFTCSSGDCLNNEKVYLDDLLIKPYNSSSKSYVYDNKNNRLESILDENHFATYYQYNAKGDLIRKRKETYDGEKTIADAQYNTPKSERVSTGESQSGLINQESKINKNHFQNLRVSPSEILKFKKSQSDGPNVNSKFNLFDVKINADSSSFKYFDINLNEGIIKDSIKLKKINPIDSTTFNMPDFKLDSTQIKKYDDLDRVIENDKKFRKLKKDVIEYKDSLDSKVKK